MSASVYGCPGSRRDRSSDSSLSSSWTSSGPSPFLKSMPVLLVKSSTILAQLSCFSGAELHLDSPAVVSRVDMDGPIARGLRPGHIVSDLVGPSVSFEAVGTESLYDPLNLFLGVENGAAASDVLHGRQVHRGEPPELVLDGGQALEPP